MAPTRRLLSALCLVSLAACGGDGSGSDRLTLAEVAGSYRVCSLRFRPENTGFPVADLLASVMDTTPPAALPVMPTLTLSTQQPEYELVYTRQRDGFLQRLRGATGLRSTSVTVRFYEETPGAVAAESLLPASMAFTFQDTPRRLTASTGFYTVRRSDYAAAAGMSETGLQERISGSLEATLRVGGCS